MKINSFFKSHEFHDSSLEKIEYNPENATVIMRVFFSCSMQLNYRKGEPETGMMNLLFSGVKDFSGKTGEVDDDSILNVAVDADFIKFLISNDETNEFYTLSFKASSVEVKNEDQ